MHAVGRPSWGLSRGLPWGQVQLEHVRGGSWACGRVRRSQRRGEGRWQGTAWWGTVRNVAASFGAPGVHKRHPAVSQIHLLPALVQSLKLRMVVTFPNMFLNIFTEKACCMQIIAGETETRQGCPSTPCHASFWKVTLGWIPGLGMPVQTAQSLVPAEQPFLRGKVLQSHLQTI